MGVTEGDFASYLDRPVKNELVNNGWKMAIF